MESSCTICVCTTRKPDFFSTSTTAGPERSTRSPREQESLTVTTAAVNTEPSVVEEDIILLFRPATTRARAGHTSASGRNLGRLFSGLHPGIALRFVEQPQALHQQALSVE